MHSTHWILLINLPSLSTIKPTFKNLICNIERFNIKYPPKARRKFSNTTASNYFIEEFLLSLPKKNARNFPIATFYRKSIRRVDIHIDSIVTSPQQIVCTEYPSAWHSPRVKLVNVETIIGIIYDTHTHTFKMYVASYASVAHHAYSRKAFFVQERY